MRYLYAALFSLLTCAAYGQGVLVRDQAVTSATNVAPGQEAPLYTIPFAGVKICTNALCTAVAPIYSSSTLTGVPLTQPYTADARGRFYFYAAAGNYYEQILSAQGTVLNTYPLALNSGGSSSSGVSSVGLSVDSSLGSWIAVGGSPVTTTGVLSLTGQSVTANYFLSAPNGSAGTMTPRAIVLADLPSSLFTLTTTGSGGAATYSSGVLNIPQYSAGITALTGDVSATGTGSVTATLATVNSSPGTVGSATTIPIPTVNAKGLVTAISSATIAPPWGSITGTLSSQSDLNTALSNLLPLSGGTLTGPLTLPSGTPAGTQAVNQTYLASTYCALTGCTLTGSLLTSGTSSTLGLAPVSTSTPTPTGAGFVGPASGGTPYYFKLPASWPGGILYGAAPSTIDGSNESLLGAASSANLVAALNTSPSSTLSASLIPAISSPAGAILPVAGIPTVTPTANVNALLYTDQLPTEWSGLTGFTITTGQNDENGNPTAALYVPTTTSTLHMVFEDPLMGYTTTTRTVTVSVWAKPSGSYSYAYFGLYVEGTGHLDTWFNTSTCATGTIATGVTASVGAVSNGYCQLIETYTIGASSGAAAPRLSHVQFGAVASNGALPINFYSGDGSSGMYLSHPQMSYTSSVQTYQHVTGPHSYCVAAYNATGVSSGCSPWVDSPYSAGAVNALNGSSEINSITTQAVTGASYCKVFRYGGTTQGALSVSGSTQIACGSTVTDNYLVGDNSTPPAVNATALLTANINNGVNSLPQIITGVDSRSIRTQSEEYYRIYSGAINRIFTAPLGSQGTITQIHVSAFAGSIDPNNTQFSIQCNGGTAQVVSAGMLMKLQGYPIPVSTPKLIINANASNNSNGPSITISGLEINFTNGCNIDVIQGTTVSNNQWFSEVTWKEGYYLSKPNHANWHAYETPLTSIANQATVNLLPTATVVGGGELEEVTLYFYGTSTTTALYGYLEGDPQVFTDGVLALVANGTEDFFCAGFYSNSGTIIFANGKCGLWVNEGITAPAGLDDFLAYRRFDSLPGDQVDFNSNLQVTWENGQAGQNFSVSTAGTYKSLVTYWGVN